MKSILKSEWKKTEKIVSNRCKVEIAQSEVNIQETLQQSGSKFRERRSSDRSDK